MTEQFRTLSFYANVAKRQTRSWGRVVKPVLDSITHTEPSKAAKVIASVKIEIRVPVSWLDREGPPVFPVSLEMSSEPRQREGVLVDLFEEAIEPLRVEVPAQEPVADDGGVA